MNFRITLLAAACIGAGSFAVAQQPSASRDTSPPRTTSPSAQTEAPTTSSTNPSAASSPHQRQAMAKGSSDNVLKDCIAQQRSEHSGMSKRDAKKACKEQLKSSSEPGKSEPTNR